MARARGEGRKRANESCKNCVSQRRTQIYSCPWGRLEEERCWLCCLLNSFFWQVCSWWALCSQLP